MKKKKRKKEKSQRCPAGVSAAKIRSDINNNKKQIKRKKKKEKKAWTAEKTAGPI